MAKFFLSHQWTLEDKVAMTQLLSVLSQEITKAGHECFCSALCQQEMTAQHLITYEERLHYCLQQQHTANNILALVVSKNRSNGMIQERLQALHLHQNYTLFTRHPEVMPELHQDTPALIRFTTDSDLQEKIYSFIHTHLQ